MFRESWQYVSSVSSSMNAYPEHALHHRSVVVVLVVVVALLVVVVALLVVVVALLVVVVALLVVVLAVLAVLVVVMVGHQYPPHEVVQLLPGAPVQYLRSIAARWGTTHAFQMHLVDLGNLPAQQRCSRSMWVGGCAPRAKARWAAAATAAWQSLCR